MHAARYGHKDTIEVLLKEGRDGIVMIDMQDSRYEATALMLGVSSGHEEVVARLCNAGCNVSLTDRFGRTAMDIARVEAFDNIVGIIERASRPGGS